MGIGIWDVFFFPFYKYDFKTKVLSAGIKEFYILNVPTDEATRFTKKVFFIFWKTQFLVIINTSNYLHHSMNDADY